MDTSKLEQLIQALGEEEIKALLEGIRGDGRSSPQFLSCVRKFMKENNLINQPDKGTIIEMEKVIYDSSSIPTFEDLEN